MPGSPSAGAPHGFPGASPWRPSESSTASLTARCSELSSHGTPARSIGLGSSTGLSGVNIRDMVASARSPPAPDQVSCWMLPCFNGAACFAVSSEYRQGPCTQSGELLNVAMVQRCSLLCSCSQSCGQLPRTWSRELLASALLQWCSLCCSCSCSQSCGQRPCTWSRKLLASAMLRWCSLLHTCIPGCGQLPLHLIR